VEELMVRGADPNLFDMVGCSVMNGAIHHEQWGTVNLLIEYLANIYTPAPVRSLFAPQQTPLQLLINQRQGELIHHTLMWCPDQEKGVNDSGETTLHAIALDKRPELLYWQVVRGVNPLMLTKETVLHPYGLPLALKGQSVLLYAVQNSHCPQRMVAECIRLGFSTHQPALTSQRPTHTIEWLAEITRHRPIITSPLLLAVVLGLPVVAHMLYESGSCSPTELLLLYKQLLELSDPDTRSRKTLLESINRQAWGGDESLDVCRKRYDELINNIATFLPCLKKMVSTPRSLVSTCRLVILRCLAVHRRHERTVRHLTLPVRSPTGEIESEEALPVDQKNYLLFSNLTDPQYRARESERDAPEDEG
jgi:hypothetical protein